jgi:hypothetical protein
MAITKWSIPVTIFFLARACSFHHLAACSQSIVITTALAKFHEWSG